MEASAPVWAFASKEVSVDDVEHEAMRAALALMLAFASVDCGQGATPATEASETASTAPDLDPAAAEMAVEATPISATEVQFVVTTNLPTPVEVMAAVALTGQAPDDVFIGYNKRVTLTGSRTEFVLDTSPAREPLPSGEYDAEVNFYPRWGAENGNPAARSAPDLSAVSRIMLGGSGENRADAERRNELQRWVMGNMGMNEPWDRASYEARLGPARKGPSTMSRLHDAYYFPDADMTFLVNRLRDEVTVWRMGDVTE